MHLGYSTLIVAGGLFASNLGVLAQEPSDCVGTEFRLDPKTGKALSGRCIPYSEMPDYFSKEERLRAIGELGPAGRARAAFALQLMKDENWGVRAAAAKTLGLVGETKAIPGLIAAIGSPDWRLTVEAMISLKRLNAIQAEDVLKEIAKGYWQPGIRAAAQRLLNGLYDPKMPDSDWPYLSPIAAYCDSDAGKAEARLAGELTSHPDLERAALAERIVTPKDGRLFAVNAGEFGGSLEFQPATGPAIEIIKDEAVVAVIAGSSGIFALTGTPHMESDDGRIYRIETAADGSWTARTVWRLPGAPLEIIYTPDGVMGISTNYGDVIFRPDHGMEWISCPARE